MAGDKIGKHGRAVRRRIAVCAAAAACALPAMAQEARQLGSELQWLQQEEVVVTNDRSPRRTETIPSNITVITAEQIEHSGARQVPDVLRYYAGIDVHDLYGNGRQARVDLRSYGFNADASVLVLVDGRRINGVTLYSTDWTTVPLERVARIEVVRGGQSVIYGSQAIAGAINIITRRGTVEKLLEAGVDLASWGYRKPYLNFSGTALVADGSLTYHLNASRTESSGYRDNSRLELSAQGVSLNFQKGDFSLDASAGHKTDQHGQPGGIRETARRRSADSQDNRASGEDTYLHLVPSLRIAPGHRVQVALDYGKVRGDSHNTFGGFVVDLNDRVTQTSVSPQYIAEHRFAGVSNRLSAGIDQVRSQVDRAATFGPLASRATARGVYFSDTASLFDDRLHIDAGLRRERVRYDVRDTTRTVATVRPTAWKFAGTWNYREGSKLFAVLDRSYRTQLLDEIGSPTVLQPPVSRQIQLGLAHRFGKAGELRAALLDIRTKGEIDFDATAFANINGAAVRRRGLEAEGTWAITTGLQATASFTYLDAKWAEGPNEGKRFPLTSPTKGTVGLAWSPIANVTVDGRYRWVADKIIGGDNANVVRWNDSYHTLDVGVGYKTPRYAVAAGVLNATGEQYSEYGFGSRPASFTVWPSPQRTLYLRLTFHHLP
jgi:iron complex outermembrane recepter protein